MYLRDGSTMTFFVDSLRYCQQHKGLELYAWCLMTNHAHLILSSAQNDAGCLGLLEVAFIS